MDVALDGRLQQEVTLAENPIGRLADGREHDAAVGDRARAVDDEADETGGDQDQAEGPGKEPKHEGLLESPLRRGTRSRRAAQGAFRAGARRCDDLRPPKGAYTPLSAQRKRPAASLPTCASGVRWRGRQRGGSSII